MYVCCYIEMETSFRNNNFLLHVCRTPKIDTKLSIYIRKHSLFLSLFFLSLTLWYYACGWMQPMNTAISLLLRKLRTIELHLLIFNPAVTNDKTINSVSYIRMHNVNYNYQGFLLRLSNPLDNFMTNINFYNEF